MCVIYSDTAKAVVSHQKYLLFSLLIMSFLLMGAHFKLNLVSPHGLYVKKKIPLNINTAGVIVTNYSCIQFFQFL